MPKSVLRGNITFDPESMLLSENGLVHFMCDENGSIYSIPISYFTGIGINRPTAKNYQVHVETMTLWFTPLPGKEQEVRRWAARMNLMSSKQKVAIRGGESE